MDVLGDQIGSLIGISRANGGQDGGVLVDRLGHAAAKVEGRGAVAAHTVDEAGVDRFQVAVACLFYQKTMEFGIGSDEGDGVVRIGGGLHGLLEGVELFESSGVSASAPPAAPASTSSVSRT